MRRCNLMLAAALALVAPMAQAAGLVAWSSDSLGIAAQVPEGWPSAQMYGGGYLFTAPGFERHVAPHVALRAHPDSGADLGAAHDQMLQSLLLDGDQVISDQHDKAGFDLRSLTALGKVELRKTVRLNCKGGPILAELRIDYMQDQSAEMAPLLADIPGSLACK
ncbi:hypothetical protein AB4874_02490 [Thioclava sp. 15-R06ZXC-3]|uniref:Uncharacterized protein n=1 Tax=Thioclava arctica TaxID=3238301 RepID=A0ABV3TFY5_9RHOB